MPINIGSAVLVTGDTFAKKAQIAAIGGGSWCKPLSGWIFPEEKRDAVVAALGDEATSGPSPAQPVATPSKDAHATLTVGPYKRSIMITGDTKNVKEQCAHPPEPAQRLPLASATLPRTLGSKRWAARGTRR